MKTLLHFAPWLVLAALCSAQPTPVTPSAGTGSGDVTASGDNNFTGINSFTGATVKPANAIGALAIDVTKGINTKTVSADQTFTFSGTPATAGTIFSLRVTNSDAAAHTLTVPSSFAVGIGTVTSVVIPASGKLLLTWEYDGSAYNLYGAPALTSGTGAFALTDSAALTGTPTTPTAASTVNNTQIASTEYVSLVTKDVALTIAQALGSSIKAQPPGLSFNTANASNALVSGDFCVQAVYIPSDITITGVMWFQTVAGNYTADASNMVGLYTYSGGTLTRVAVSADSGNTWKATSNTYTTLAFTSPYAATKGLYFIGYLYHSSAQTTAPSILGIVTAINNAQQSPITTNSAAFAAKLAGQTTIPTSQAMSGMTNLTAPRWLALY